MPGSSMPVLCPPLFPVVSSNSCPLSQGCYLIISPSASLFSFCFPFFPASGSLPMNPVLHDRWQYRIWDRRYLSLGLSRVPACSETMVISPTSLQLGLNTKLSFPLRVEAGAQLYNRIYVETGNLVYTACSCPERDTNRES